MRYSHMERKGMLNKMKLLSQELLIKTGPVDHADWNYRPLLGLISRTRFRLVRDMMRDGRFLWVTRNNSPILDAGLKLLTRQSASKDFGDRRKNLIPTLLRHFSVVEERPVPRIGASVLRVYTGLKLCRRAARGLTEAQSPDPLKRAG